jgi:hypothetical protein
VEMIFFSVCFLPAPPSSVSFNFIFPILILFTKK